MSQEPHRHFDEDLSRLKDRLLDMSGRIEQMLERAMTALERHDSTAAALVIEDDARIDALEIEIEDRVTHLLARQQPVARDLRLLLAVLKISNDLERVGDHAVNIAQSAIRMASVSTEIRPELIEMSRIAREMLSDALDAFVRGDARAGRTVCATDDKVDALHRSLYGIVLEEMQQAPSRAAEFMQLSLVSRNLERVADLATNIAEDVVFFVEGTTIKHHAESR